jgi:hypothetical protein
MGSDMGLEYSKASAMEIMIIAILEPLNKTNFKSPG